MQMCARQTASVPQGIVRWHRHAIWQMSSLPAKVTRRVHARTRAHLSCNIQLLNPDLPQSGETALSLRMYHMFAIHILKCRSNTGSLMKNKSKHRTCARSPKKGEQCSIAAAIFATLAPYSLMICRCKIAHTSVPQFVTLWRQCGSCGENKPETVNKNSIFNSFLKNIFNNRGTMNVIWSCLVADLRCSL